MPLFTLLFTMGVVNISKRLAGMRK